MFLYLNRKIPALGSEDIIIIIYTVPIIRNIIDFPILGTFMESTKFETRD